MRWQIERHRQPHLSSRQIAAVKMIGLLGCRKTSILPNRPGACGIHAWIGAAQKGRKAGLAIGGECLLVGMAYSKGGNGNLFGIFWRCWQGTQLHAHPL